MRGGPQDRPGSQLKMRFFSTEIDGSGWALVFWIFDQNRAFTGFRISSFSRFSKVFQNFSVFFKVFQCFSGCFRACNHQNRAFTGFRISSFLRFFKVFQNFSVFFLRFFNVFQDVSGLVTLNSDEGPPPRPFHSLVLVKGGSYFSILKAK